jgi:RNA polymerase sigma factor (sigma-70 family)
LLCLHCPVSIFGGGYTMKGNMGPRDLLCAYVEQHSETAFARLVELYLDLVYSAALRLVRDADVAKDVCQAVFLRLARKAASVRDGRALAGWLYRATCFEAKTILRSEGRRREREMEAMRRSDLDSDAEEAWMSVWPVLEEAMEQLGAEEQNAILLRFFENKPYAEVGRSLNINEEAARKRVNRALEHLQRLLTGQGVRVSAVALSAVLSARAVQATPQGLALSVASVAVADASVSVGVLAGILPSLFMSKPLIITLAALGVGLVLTPVLVKNRPKPAPAAQASLSRFSGQPQPVLLTNPGEQRTAIAQPARTAPRSSVPTLLGRVADLRPLTPSQIEAFVEQRNRTAESLLAAYRACTNRVYLAEAAKNFPGDTDVQYEIVATRFFPNAQRQWIDAYKTSASADALPWYFSALEYFKRGDVDRAIKDLAVASSRANFGAEFAPTLNALEELHVSAGRATDEARIVAFQTCAQVPHLLPMRELAKEIQTASDRFRQQNDVKTAENLIAAGFALGGHLSAGSGSQTVLNQLVGIAIERKFLQQLNPPDNRDPFGRPIPDVKAAIEEQQASLKQHAQTLMSFMPTLGDAELDAYMERVKLFGEASALAWLKSNRGAK